MSHIKHCEDFIRTATESQLTLNEMKILLEITALKLELIKCHGNQSQAARNLNISRTTLKSYLQRAERND